MTTLVTGATGLVGNNVVRMLLERGESVRVLVRGSSDPRPLDSLDVETVRGDVCDAESVARACGGVKRVIHSAGYVRFGWRHGDLHQAINLEGTRNVARAARQAGARLVHVSSVDALGMGSPDSPADEESPREGKVPSPYVLTKRDAEAVVRLGIDEGLDAVIVNPTFMLGPWDWKPSSGKMLLEVARRFTPLAPRGTLNACDVRDVAAGILAAAEQAPTGRQYVLGGENLSYLDFWRQIAEVTGGRAPLGRMGPLVPRLAGWFGDLRGRISGEEPEVNSAAIAMSLRVQYYSSARAERELNYRPRPVSEAIAAAWTWFCQYGYAQTAGAGSHEPATRCRRT